MNENTIYAQSELKSRNNHLRIEEDKNKYEFIF